MNRSTKNMAKGAALGVMAGTAVGAIGAYAAQKSPKEWKKTMKKAAHTAEKELDRVDKMQKSFLSSSFIKKKARRRRMDMCACDGPFLCCML